MTSAAHATLVRRGFRLVVLAGGLTLAACTTATPASYNGTIDNIRTLDTLPPGKVALGPFTTGRDVSASIPIRASTFEPPNKGSFGEYLKSALQAELAADGRFDASAPIVISGELRTNMVNADIGTGTAHLSARFVVARSGVPVYDKVLNSDTQWESSFLGAVAIPLARQQYVDAVKKLIGNLFADPDFRRAF